MFYDVLWATTLTSPHPNVAAKSLLAPQTQSCQTFQNSASPAVACCCAGLKNGINGILKIPETGIVNGCHTTNINQPQKIAIASCCQCMNLHESPCLQPQHQLPPSDDLPCATLSAMVGDPLPASPTSFKTNILLAHCEDRKGYSNSNYLRLIGVLAQSQVTITVYLFYIPKLSAVRFLNSSWSSRSSMVFHYLLTQKSTWLCRGAFQEPPWQLP